VGLAHVLISQSDEGGIGRALEVNVRKVWSEMKARTVREIAELYSSGDESRHADLQHALIVNANLDLNQAGAK
jgi:hypothetical protein